MNDFPEDNLRKPTDAPSEGLRSHAPPEPPAVAQEAPDAAWPFASSAPSPEETGPLPAAVEPSDEPLLFQSFMQPVIKRPVRIPHFGHLALLLLLSTIGFVCTVAFLFVAMRFHILGLQPSVKSTTDIHVILVSEAILYIVTFGVAVAVFPFLWGENYFAGVHWRGSVALQKFWALFGTALGCFALATLDEALLPGPSNAPIEKMLRAPGAAWLMFAFGVTIAPFFEEMFFRGFLLPALCTAYDWTAERITHRPAPALDANGHPQWSLPAMVIGSLFTSLPFALIHVEQQGHSLGPFLLLIVVSLVLCTVRLRTRSLAASTLVHACYNFCIFSVTLVVTGGFHHLDKI